MIKLGVFDLDGTLLDSEGKLPETFYSDIEVLSKRGTHVAIASARPAQFLFEMFDSLWLIKLRNRDLVGDSDRDGGNGEQSKSKGQAF